MPGQDGHMTPDEQKKAQEWLRTTWKIANCPFHGATSWEVNTLVTQLMPFTGGGLLVGGSVYPALVVTCALCGYTVLVGAVKAGILAQPAPAQPEPPKKAGESSG